MNETIEIEQLEERLRAAMIGGNVGQLEQLLGDASVFTNQDGQRLTKEDDLSTHRSGLLKIADITTVGDPVVRRFGDMAIVSVTVTLGGHYAGQAFEGTFAYTRVWHCQNGNWQIEAAHCSTAVLAG